MTMARRLGMTEHLSPLLKKLERLGIGSAEALMHVAFLRGCRYYGAVASGAVRDPGEALLTNEELAVALLHGGLPWESQTVRCGAAMVSAPGVCLQRLVRLARMERCERVLRQVALAGQRFEPQNPFWCDLLTLLPRCPEIPAGALPHPTRYVAMSGLKQGGRGVTVQWIRPVPAEIHG